MDNKRLKKGVSTMPIYIRLQTFSFAALSLFVLGNAAMAVNNSDRGFAPPEDLNKNDAQFSCMNFVSGSLEDPQSVKFDFFKYYTTKVLTDGSYNVLVTYDMSGKHTVSCTVKKSAAGDWTLVETKPVETKEVK